MAKKAPFFSHDMNARHDPKISAMRGVYGAEGYGWFWMLVEMMAEADGYQLDRKSKYAFNAYAMQLQCKPDILLKFVSDCIDEFELFESDDTNFWSNSLRKRMQYRDTVSEKRAAAAQKRWGKKSDDANAMQNDANETKQNETKQNETKQNETINNTTPTTPGAPFRLFETEGFGTISGTIAEKLGEMIDFYGERWVIEAMKEASLSGKRSLKYVESILRRYQAEGIDEPWKAERKGSEQDGKYGRRIDGYKSGSNQSTRTGKPQLTVVDSQSDPLTPEELEEIQRLARKLDGAS